MGEYVIDITEPEGGARRDRGEERRFEEFHEDVG